MAIYSWFHRFVRKNTTPLQENQALLWKRRLSVAYGVLAWNAFGVIIYMIYQGKADWAHFHGLKTDEERNMAPGRAWANTLGIENAKVYRVSKFQIADEYDIVDGKQQRVVKPQVEE